LRNLDVPKSDIKEFPKLDLPNNAPKEKPDDRNPITKIDPKLMGAFNNVMKPPTKPAVEVAHDPRSGFPRHESSQHIPASMGMLNSSSSFQSTENQMTSTPSGFETTF
jgi:hypothetical protein